MLLYTNSSQVVLGACRLVPTPKYYPLRFHCAKILGEISASTATFIPILPIYLEVLNNFNFSKKSRKASMKPLDFSCILKLAKSQLEESGMKEATMEEVYSGLLSYLADNSNRIGFPELVTPMQFQLNYQLPANTWKEGGGPSKVLSKLSSIRSSIISTSQVSSSSTSSPSLSSIS